MAPLDRWEDMGGAQHMMGCLMNVGDTPTKVWRPFCLPGPCICELKRSIGVTDIW